MDTSKQISYSKDAWKNYLDIYDRAAEALIDLRAPNAESLVCHTNRMLQTSTVDDIVRGAFYAAFTTVKETTRSSGTGNSSSTQDERVFVNDSWLNYFCSVIKNRSGNTCVFRIKSYRTKLNASLKQQQQQQSSGGGGGILDDIGLFGKKLSGSNNNNNKTTNNKTTNTPTSNFKNGYFTDDLEVDNDDDEESVILRYRYEKDFVLLKSGTPHIITMSPDWGIPFHFKDNIALSQPPPAAATAGHHSTKHTSKKHKSGNSQANNNNSGGSKDNQWCSIM
eukprot:gene1503-1750_t